MKFPAAVPEIPVTSIDEAVAYYVDVLGFSLGWGDEQGGIAGVWKGSCRLFLTNRTFRTHFGNACPSVIWLNVESRAEVDELYAAWKAANAKLVSEPEDKPWKLREFLASDPDGNLLRVFYDFRWETESGRKASM